MSAAPVNLHATGVVLADRGVLIAGEPGSGKSLLGLALISAVRGLGLHARLVADDQVLLSVAGGRLLASAPAAIAGLAELRGVGPRRVDFEPSAVIDLHVRLVAPEDAPRLGDAATQTLCGVDLPALLLPRRGLAANAFAILATLGLGPAR